MRFLGSPKESLEVAEGQVVGLSCRRRARHPFIAQRSIFLLLASLFKHDVWISLTPDEAARVTSNKATTRSTANRGRPLVQVFRQSPGDHEHQRNR